MPDHQWLDGYNGESVDELIALEGKYRTDSLVLAFEQAMDQKAARVGENKLTAEERITLAIEALEREVNNGGYGQFFVNSSREYAPIIVDALRRIGCPKTAEITQKALSMVQQAPMSDDEIENGTWEENEERQDALGECDSLYFNEPQSIPPGREHLFRGRVRVTQGAPQHLRHPARRRTLAPDTLIRPGTENGGRSHPPSLAIVGANPSTSPAGSAT
jgi:hypothetical protein